MSHFEGLGARRTGRCTNEMATSVTVNKDGTGNPIRNIPQVAYNFRLS